MEHDMSGGLIIHRNCEKRVRSPEGLLSHELRSGLCVGLLMFSDKKTGIPFFTPFVLIRGRMVHIIRGSQYHVEWGCCRLLRRQAAGGREGADRNPATACANTPINSCISFAQTVLVRRPVLCWSIRGSDLEPVDLEMVPGGLQDLLFVA